MPIYLNTVRRVRNGYELQRVCIETVAALSTIDKLQTTRTFSTGRLVLLNCYSGVCMQTFFVVSESRPPDADSECQDSALALDASTQHWGSASLVNVVGVRTLDALTKVIR